ncbi:MAG: hypothetical protein OEX17_05855, partial [Rhodospirillaceae bacterium]|nr:hypothetical protein [Rhodospirillaceae bacterium]
LSWRCQPTNGLPSYSIIILYLFMTLFSRLSPPNAKDFVFFMTNHTLRLQTDPINPKLDGNNMAK